MDDPVSQPPCASKVIAIAVVEHEGMFLIGQRPPGIPLAGLWEFPGGKVEPGESPREGAIRECLEETGLAIEVVGEYPVNPHDYAHDRVELHFFACRIIGPGSPREPFCWVAKEQLANYEFPAGNGELLAILAR